MRQLFLLLLISIFNLSHTQENNEIKDVFEKHAFSRKQLASTRGMQPPQEFKKSSVTDYLYNYTNNTAILVYTFIEDTLQILILNKEYKLYEDKDKSNSYNRYKNHHLIKTSYHQNDVINDINELNSYFSSQFSNILFSDRGSIPNNTKLKERDFQKLFDKVNKYLLPDELNLENIEHLIIVPTSNIGTIPFSALKIGDNYLIDHMSYSIAPSLSSLTNETKSRKNGFDNALFISNPDFPKDDKWNFAKLPGTEKEVQNITSNLESDSYKILNGINASKNNIERNMQNYELLYFATHGYSDPENSLDNSFIALSGENSKQAFITPREIQHKTLKAKLVVLSACQTGLGVTHEGGIIGLSRAFQLAGADHVLMSLWSISDNETATLMTRFFNEYLNNGQFTSPHEALRQAILKYKAEINSNPMYWAAFSIFGAPYTDNVLDSHIKVCLNQIKNSQIFDDIKNYIIDAQLGEIVEEEILSDIVVIENSNSYRAIPYELFRDNEEEYLYDNDRDIEYSNIDEIKKTIFTYAQGDFLKKFRIKNKNYQFDFKLIPVEMDSDNDTIIKILPDDYLNNENGIIEVKPETDHVVLQVTNEGTSPLYFSILEIDVMGEIYSFLPNDNCYLDDDAVKLNPGQTKTFKDCIFTFGPPYGKYVLKGFSSEYQFNFTIHDEDQELLKARVREATKLYEMQLFTQELEYIIIKNK